MAERTIPADVASERSIIGVMLNDVQACTYILNKLVMEDFYVPKNAHVFECIKKIVSSGGVADLLSVKAEIEKANKYNAIEDIVDIAKMAQASLFLPSEIKQAIKRLKELTALRNMIKICNDTMTLIYEGDLEAKAIINTAGEKILNLSLKSGSAFRHIKNVLMESYVAMSKQNNNKGKTVGITTGFKQLDNTLAGLQQEQLIVIAAPPGHGKTSFAMDIVKNAAEIDNAKIAVFSLEMGDCELGMRLLCSKGEVDSSFAKLGKLDAESFDRLAWAQEELSNTNIFVDDGVSTTTTEMMAKCRYQKLTRGLDLVVIDYLQLMTSTLKNGSTVDKISQITRDLKLMAKQLKLPVVCLSQLSRDGTNNDNGKKSPELRHLRGSGSIEQDADVVIFIHRPNYDPDTPSVRERAEIKVAKNRSGITRKIDMIWEAQYTRFTEGCMKQVSNDEIEGVF